MRIKTIALGLAICGSMIGSSRSSASKRLGDFCKFKFNEMCINTGTARTNEPICNLVFSGPVCTVTPAGLGATVTAYPTFSNCDFPLRITNP
ncbi:hypothetical protein [Pedobacter ginsenosidimutans]|uniref:hypothetical protein n=1 Tax=Pedobacter ginsenosidimutans TaxID=687842 RepID=UPI0012F81BBC|nr:hypothetical protein [Pedobacter ginsenosidimutans]